MKSFIKWMKEAPKLLKIIFALPFLDIVWNIYRLARSIDKKSVLGIVIAILLIVIGWSFLWILDLITIIVGNKVLWID
ncbi:MAG: hypothetical protein HFK07_00915 [Clostridia bacterium]|jgi:hypothetical protein|nr:hypothetical protein [Clostridia bacterium]MCX4366863.1 hypothetical protein [Clostridia bacterium]